MIRQNMRCVGLHLSYPPGPRFSKTRVPWWTLPGYHDNSCDRSSDRLDFMSYHRKQGLYRGTRYSTEFSTRVVPGTRVLYLGIAMVIRERSTLTQDPCTILPGIVVYHCSGIIVLYHWYTTIIIIPLVCYSLLLLPLGLHSSPLDTIINEWPCTTTSPWRPLPSYP